LDDNHTLQKTDLDFLNKISKKYKIKTSDKHKYDLVNELLDRVDIIPNSIVLAQAANESGWGTSRFAKEFNALFGEYTYDYSDGVVPLLRKEGEKHLVKSFESVNKSVQSYFNNLNSHYAYKDFREVRKIMREKNNFSNLNLLIEELDSYAADINYIKIINSIIDVNKFHQFDAFSYSINNS
jgi:Bax protein